MKIINTLKSQIEPFEEIEENLEEINILLELLELETDEEIKKELKTLTENTENKLEKLSLQSLFDGEYDMEDAIISINSGAGGLEAQDWAEMLLRMYNRYGQAKGYKMETLDIQPDPAGGIKSATLKFSGPMAYGHLHTEKGVHRLVRISPFDSQSRRHTSFASVDVYPEIQVEEVEIDPSELKIDTYRASGAGGQHVNTTDSAVRITHIPTGLVVQCQSERSQHSNRETAMKMLVSRLVQIKESEQKETISEISGDHSQIAWGNQIRSYVYHPYQMVKDHRTDMEIGDINRVMDGDLDPLIYEYLKVEE